MKKLLTTILFIGFIGLIVPSAANAASNSVLDFDGSDYLVASDNAVFDQADRLSISVWAKPDVAGDDYILYRSGAYYLKLTSSSTIEGAIYYSAAFHTVTSSAITVDSLTWTHIEMTYDKTDGKLKIFLNGELDKSADYSTSVAAAATDLYIGADSTPANYFDGKIDDVRMYQYARSLSDVRVDYNDGLAVRFASPRRSFSEGGGEGCSLDPASCMDYGLVGNWNMDEGSGTTAYDASDNSNDGTLTNSPKWTEGKEGGGLQFDGTDDYVDCGTPSSLQPSIVTTSAWVNVSDDGSGAFPGIVVTGAQNKGYMLVYTNSDNKIRFYIYDSAWQVAISDSAVAFGEWYHLVGVYDGSNVLLYINGVLQSITDTATSINYGTSYSEIGKYRDDPSIAYFNGSIDGVKIYNRALSAEEVRYHYNRGGPVAHWRMDEGEGSTLYDETSNNNDGTFGDGTCLPGAGKCPTWVAGKHSSALSFDGTDDYVDVNTIILADDTSYTISMWIKPDSVDDKGLWGNTLTSGNYSRCFLRTNEIYIYDDSNNKICDFDHTATVGVWQHIVLVHDYSVTDFRLYIDGIDKGSYNTGAANTAQTIKMIGGLGDVDDYTFDGSIDDVKIYNYARSPEQILVDYNAGLAAHLK